MMSLSVELRTALVRTFAISKIYWASKQVAFSFPHILFANRRRRLLIITLASLWSHALGYAVSLSTIETGRNVTAVEIISPSVSGGKFLLRTKSAEGLEYWFTDGSNEGGLERITNIPTIDGNSFLAEPLLSIFDGRGYARIHDQLWETDGTQRGTTLFLDTTPQWIAVQEDRMFIMGQVAEGDTDLILYRSDGYLASNIPIKPPAWSGKLRSVKGFTDSAGSLLFSIDQELWKTDGTLEGTVLVEDLVVTNSFVRSMSPVINGKVLLHYPIGIGLWMARSTGGGLELLFPDLDVEYISPVLLQDMVVFQAFNNTSERNALHVFVTDGTREGTRQLQLNNARAPQYLPDSEYKGQALILLNQIVPLELWTTDGFSTHRKIQEIPNALTSFATLKLRDGLYLLGILKIGGQRELWITDYTTAGTRLIQKLPTGKVTSLHRLDENRVMFATSPEAESSSGFDVVNEKDQGESQELQLYILHIHYSTGSSSRALFSQQAMGWQVWLAVSILAAAHNF